MKGRSYRATGGSTRVEEGDVVSETTPSVVYAGKGSEVEKAASDRTSKFKKGGKVGLFGRGKMSEGMEEKMEKKAKKDGG